MCFKHQSIYAQIYMTFIALFTGSYNGIYVLIMKQTTTYFSSYLQYAAKLMTLENESRNMHNWSDMRQ